MKNIKLNFKSITLENIKNVEFGKIDFKNKDNEIGNILGIYGQNGSGKTAVVEVIEIIKRLFSGEPIKAEKYYDVIKVDSDEASIAVELYMEIKGLKVIIAYNVVLERKENEKCLYIKKENLSYQLLGKSKAKQKIIDYVYSDYINFIFPKALNEDIKATLNTEDFVDIIVSKELSYDKSSSFLFLERSMKQIGKYYEKKDKNVYPILKALNFFGTANLFVIKNEHSGIITMNTGIAFNFRFEDKNSTVGGDIAIKLFDQTLLPNKVYPLFERLVKKINIVLKALIPDMELGIQKYDQILDGGEDGKRIEMTSLRGTQKVPLRCESEGIKKLISILGSLIELFNKPNMCLVVDELDSGIYEYLLGELLEIFEDNAKGQLIFTSHNLRPLEMLKKDNIIFTTVNPDNRYIKFTNIRPNNNLRDSYIRCINVGGQKEPIYNATDSYEIAHAFEKAGNYGEEN